MRAAAALALLISGGLILTSGSGSPSFAATLKPADQDIIQKYMSGLADQVGGNIPEEVTPTILTGDLNHDGIPDAAALFTIEGPGNNYGQYLAVYIRVKGKLVPTAHATVGGKFYRSIEMKSIQNDVIYFATTSYADKDPACCPTIKGTTRYELMGNQLKELTSK